MDDCMHLLPPGTCVTCNSPRTPARRLIDTKPERRMRSRYDSRCLRCDEWISEGDDIALHDGIWIHAEHFEGGL